MDQEIHKLEDVPLKEQPIFEQLFAEFGPPCKIFRRPDDFGRWLRAEVVNTPPPPTAAMIELRKGIRERDTQLSRSEIQRIREHLASGALKNLLLCIPEGHTEHKTL